MGASPANSHGNGYPLGLAGAISATRYVGGTATVAPTTGTFAVGDFVVSQNGTVWVCTVAGTPGTWVQVGAAGPGTLVSYAEITAPVSVTATTEATGDLIVSLGSVTYAAVSHRLEFYAPRFTMGGSGTLQFTLWEDASVLGAIGFAGAPTALQVFQPVLVARYRTPSAGAHTYKVTAFRGAAVGDVQAGAGGSGDYVPAYLRAMLA